MADADYAGALEPTGEERPPATPIVPPPVFVWPPRPLAALRFVVALPGYLLPFNAAYMALAILTWFFLTPDLARMAAFSWDWIALIWLRNLALTFLVFGGLHYWFYIRRGQGTRYMLNRREPTSSQRRFLFANQVRENVFWTAGSGVAVWTAYEVVTLWMFANGYVPFLE